MTAPGRPRDAALDRTILEHAAELMASEGVDAVTVSRVAELANTTRPAIYRRFGSAAELAVAALHHLAADTAPRHTGDHLADLEAELRHFRDGITTTNSIALVGGVLSPGVDDGFASNYRELLVAPRRTRIASILRAARIDGALDAEPSDLDIAVTMCTGSYYAAALAGVETKRDWPRRTARLVWRAAGGSVED